MTPYGEKLSLYRKLGEPRAIKEIRQSIVITNNSSTIDQNQQLLVRFPNLSNNDVNVPRSVCLAFEIEVKSTDANSTNYQIHVIIHVTSKMAAMFYLLRKLDVSRINI